MVSRIIIGREWEWVDESKRIYTKRGHTCIAVTYASTLPTTAGVLFSCCSCTGLLSNCLQRQSSIFAYASSSFLYH